MRREFRGYDPVAVDAFLSRCLATPGVYRSRFPDLRDLLPAGERVSAQEIRDVRFPSRLVGYPIRTVDALLDELAAAVERTTWRAPELTRVIDLVEPSRRLAAT